MQRKKNNHEMELNYIYSAVLFLMGVLLLILYKKDPFPKEKDMGKNVSTLVIGIVTTIGGLISLLRDLF